MVYGTHRGLKGELQKHLPVSTYFTGSKWSRNDSLGDRLGRRLELGHATGELPGKRTENRGLGGQLKEKLQIGNWGATVTSKTPARTGEQTGDAYTWSAQVKPRVESRSVPDLRNTLDFVPALRKTTRVSCARVGMDQHSSRMCETSRVSTCRVGTTKFPYSDDEKRAITNELVGLNSSRPTAKLRLHELSTTPLREGVDYYVNK